MELDIGEQVLLGAWNPRFRDEATLLRTNPWVCSTNRIVDPAYPQGDRMFQRRSNFLHGGVGSCLLMLHPRNLPVLQYIGSTDNPIELSAKHVHTGDGACHLRDDIESGSRRSFRMYQCPQPTAIYGGREEVPLEPRGEGGNGAD